MLRSLHKNTGMFATVLVLVLALSGVTLSVMPAWNKLQAPAMIDTSLNVADLAARVPDRPTRGKETHHEGQAEAFVSRHCGGPA